MDTGAVITAAGLSSRMGDFKPLLSIGNMSIAQRVVATLQQAGVEKIVMVTGFNATMLERQMANQGIVFLRNENYKNTQMFDSARIGLNYLQDKCDRVLFTPVDIPLFTAATVRRLMDCDEMLAVPECGGQTGHPIMISCSLLGSILSYDGDGGLQGALENCGVPICQIPVPDEGILHDADTPEDYNKLLQYHNEQLVRPVVNITLSREREFFDRRLALLMQLVEETGSVRQACQRMQMSYSSGWNAIRTLESQFDKPLIHRNQGGAGSKRSRLTEEGKHFLALYEAYTAAVKSSAEALFEDYFRNMFHEEK